MIFYNKFLYNQTVKLKGQIKIEKTTLSTVRIYLVKVTISTVDGASVRMRLSKKEENWPSGRQAVLQIVPHELQFSAVLNGKYKEF